MARLWKAARAWSPVRPMLRRATEARLMQALVALQLAGLPQPALLQLAAREPLRVRQPQRVDCGPRQTLTPVASRAEWPRMPLGPWTGAVPRRDRFVVAG